MIVKSSELPKIEKISIQQCVGWTVKNSRREIFLQHNTNRVLAKIDSVKNIIATDFSGATEASQLAINEIGEVNIKLSKAFILMLTAITNQMAFILIDAANKQTREFIKLIPIQLFPEGRL
jgi:sulfate adenylyltransferase subunit 1